MIKIAGTALAVVWNHNARPALAGQQQPANAPRASKPMFLPPDDATDAAVHSRAENLFWCDMMAEHAEFFSMLMPGTELASQRIEAEAFQRTFQNHFEAVRTAALDRSNYAAFNRSTIEKVKPFIEYKHRLRDAQQAGKIRTLVFPLFFDHAAREAQRAAERLEKLAAGNVALEFSEVVEFWSATSSEHSSFIAHLLDPQEQDLISHALDSSALFKGFQNGNRDRAIPRGQILLATEELIDFETVVEDGVHTGRVKSILHPLLADHMRRETLKFVDELKRSGSRT
jgi:hypothetical protein